MASFVLLFGLVLFFSLSANGLDLSIGAVATSALVFTFCLGGHGCHQTVGYE